jgi:hypothetical protein
MGLKLYEIASEYKAIADELIENGGEFTDDTLAKYNAINESLEVKAGNIANIIMQLDDRTDIVDKHIKRLEAFKKSQLNASKGIKKYLLDAMIFAGIKEIELESFKIFLRPSTAIEIVDENTLPASAFKIIPESKAVSKTLIKELLKDGKEVNGAKEVTNYSLQIK